MASDSLKILDLDVRSCFSMYFSVDLSVVPVSTKPKAWGLWPSLSLSHHSSAAFIAYLHVCSSGFATADNHHLIHAVYTFNGLVSPSDTISPVSAIESPHWQRSLSYNLVSLAFSSLYDSATPANKARFLSAFTSLATSWIPVFFFG